MCLPKLRRVFSVLLTESEGRFEAEEQAFHQRIREGFLARAERWPERFCVLDARLSPEELLACALEALGLSRRA